MTAVHIALGLCSSRVPENMNINKKDGNKKYSHIRNNGSEIGSHTNDSFFICGIDTHVFYIIVVLPILI